MIYMENSIMAIVNSILGFLWIHNSYFAQELERKKNCDRPSLLSKGLLCLLVCCCCFFFVFLGGGLHQSSQFQNEELCYYLKRDTGFGLGNIRRHSLCGFSVYEKIPPLLILWANKAFQKFPELTLIYTY